MYQIFSLQANWDTTKCIYGKFCLKCNFASKRHAGQCSLYDSIKTFLCKEQFTALCDWIKLLISHVQKRNSPVCTNYEHGILCRNQVPAFSLMSKDEFSYQNKLYISQPLINMNIATYRYFFAPQQEA